MTPASTLSAPAVVYTPDTDKRARLIAQSDLFVGDGYYNVERMLKRVLSSKGSVLLCGTCMDARGISDAELLEGARRSTMDELANTTAEADKVLIF